MNVLLVYHDDSLPASKSLPRWDLVVDFARAPASTYASWSAKTGCPAISIFDFAEGIDDLRLCRKILQSGMGTVVDRHGIDWWDVLSLCLVPELQQLILVDRLAKYIGAPSQLYTTRPFQFATVLQNRLRTTLQVSGSLSGGFRGRVRHYGNVLWNLDPAQIWQVLEDKLDRHHAIRSRLRRVRSQPQVPLILLPSAYVNVSRMAVRCAELLPDQNFLLVFARRSGRLQSLPPNVETTPLDPFFVSSSQEESGLLHEWQLLSESLAKGETMLAVAKDAGILEKIDSTLRWLLPIRDAWINILDSQKISACLCADDTNPYTRIPLLLAKNRGLPAIACHHGALDCWMALKTPAADVYLAKNELERDYLIHTCDVPARNVVLSGLDSVGQMAENPHHREKSWIVFFTEGYEAAGWRSNEVYKGLLPRLCSLAERCGLKLVLKLHPFDSVRAHRRELRRILKDRARNVEIISGPATAVLWQKVKFAVTGESSTIMECAARGIPVILCTWLGDCYSGYARQYAKFGLGLALESSDQIADIPHLLASQEWFYRQPENGIDAETLRRAFCQTAAHESQTQEHSLASYAT